MKVALVCDWLLGNGGAEKVVMAVHQMYPSAPIYTSQYDPKLIDWLKDADIRVGWLNKFSPKLKVFLPVLRARYFSRLDLSEYDMVISLNCSEAKAVKTRPDAVHICYMQGPPTQYYWSMYDYYLKNPGFGKFDWLGRLGLKIFVGRQRKLDYKFSQNPDYMIANSTYVAKEIKKYYHRDSVVITPGVEVEKFRNNSIKKREGFIIAGRQVPWKRVDLAIQACIKTGDKLTVLGYGSEHEKLARMALGQDNITILPRYNGPKELLKYLVCAQGFLFPSIEPFGITPVEAMAAGTPVIALKKGGALDIVESGKNGIFFDKQIVSDLVKAINKFKKIEFNSSVVSKSVEKFSDANFKKQMAKFIKSVC